MAVVNLGDDFERAIIEAAGLEDLNLDPGSMRVGLLNDPMTTVRFTLVVDVPFEAVRAAMAAAIE